MSVMQVLGQQGDSEFKASLATQQDPISKATKKKKRADAN